MNSQDVPVRNLSSSHPGPPGHWLLGNVAAFQADRLGFMKSVAQEYGGIVKLRLGLRSVWLVTDSAVIETVLVTQARQFRKHFGLRINPIILGNGLLTSEADFWLRQRRLAQPSFNRSQIQHYFPVFRDQTVRMMDHWKPGESRDVLSEMMTLTLAIVSQTLFGINSDSIAERVHKALQVSREQFVKQLARPLPIPGWIPTAGNRELWRAARTLDQIIYGFIQQRRNSSSQDTDSSQQDLLGRLLSARDPGSQTGMSDQQLRDECLTIFLAGHETTALALAWTWYLLSQHPGSADRLTDEVDRELSGRMPTFDDLPRLTYTAQVLNESMRLYPPAFIIGREALADVALAGYRCPRGTTILMPQSVVHRDSRFYTDPDRFLPERWAGDFEKQLPTGAYFPFGAGPRICIGNAFSLCEMTTIVALLAQKFRFHLAPGQNIKPGTQFTLRPVPGVVMTVSPR